MSAARVEQLPDTRRAILSALKEGGAATTAELAERLGMTGEAVRQQLMVLQREGWIEPRLGRAAGKVGRPATRYELTSAGDHVFPKHYDALAVALVDAVGSRLGGAALEQVLAEMTEARVRAWEGRLAGLSLPERVEALRSLYVEGDPYMDAEALDGGDFRLTERNCPYITVAMRRPSVCGVSVDALARLLGVRVCREESFQRGHGRCAFRVMAAEAAKPAAPANDVGADEDEKV